MCPTLGWRARAARKWLRCSPRTRDYWSAPGHWLAAAVCIILFVQSTTLPAPAQQVAPPAAVQAPPGPIAEPEPLPPEIALSPEAAAAIVKLTDGIDNLEKAVERVRDREEGLAGQRVEADSLLVAAQRLADSLRPRLDDVRMQIDKLGKPPDKDAAPEAVGIATERARLTGLAAELDGAIKATDLFQVRGRQQIARIQDYRRRVFTRDLMKRTQSPLLLTIWRQVGEEMPRIGRQLATLGGFWWQDARQNLPAVALVFLAAAGAFVGLSLGARRLTSSVLGPVPDPLPSFFARAGTATWVAAMRAAPVVAGTAVLYAGFDALGLLDSQIRSYAEALAIAFIVAAAVSGLAVAVLTPRYAHWRLVDLSDRSAGQLVRLTRAIAIVFATDLALREFIRLLYLPLPVSIVETFLTSIVAATLLIGVVRTRFEPSGLVGAQPVSRFRPRWLKLPLLLIAVAILVSSVLGYVALGSFVTGQVLMTVSCLVVVTLLHLAINAVALEPADATRPLGHMLEVEFGCDAERRRQLGRGLAWLLNGLLAALAIPAVLLALGFSGPDILNQAKALIFGFEIGHFRISLVRILVAIGLFAGLVFVTRLLQRWLQSALLSPARIDPGIANSIHTGIGYAGVALAGLIAVSYAGFDITNLAIVAGALSVGIGFGLQSIVNNFVSGLILLVERPIKVGDWIVVKGQEGYVRRISVRATEIETFDRSSLILPNSELITGAVTNWTHRNAMGRVLIKVGASYNADPEQVMQVLAEVAARNKLIMQYPKPLIAFDDLGASALEFSLRAVVSDINAGLEAKNMLRVEILKAFRAAGIEIPFPQYDVNLRDIEALKAGLVKAVAAGKPEPDAA